MRPITEADRKTNRDTIDAISAHNKRLTGLTTKCQRVISELCSPHMNLQFNSFYGNPLLCWQFVIDNYGPASMGHSDISGSVMSMINMKMAAEDRFMNFMVEFNIKKVHTETQDPTARALILSDGSSELKIQLLPDRLMPAVLRCIHDNKSYSDCLEHIATEDSNQHQKGVLAPDRRRSARAVTTKKAEEVHPPPALKGACYNCGNDFHSAPDCKLNACGYCEVFGCGHRSNNCPARLKKKQTANPRKNKSQNENESQKKKVKIDKRRKNVKKIAAGAEAAQDNSDSDSEDDDNARSAYSVFTRSSVRLLSSTTLEEEEEEPVIAHARMIKSVMSVQSHDFFGVIDTGCDENVTPHRTRDVLLDSVDKEYSDLDPPPVQLFNASGNTMKVTGRGSMNQYMTKTYTVEDLDITLIGGVKLTQQGLFVILIPQDESKTIGVIVCDKKGNVVMIGDKKMRVRLTEIGKKNLGRIAVPDVSQLTKIERSCDRVYGLEKMTVLETTKWTQSIFHCSKQELQWMADHIKGFPVSSEQIRKYWSEHPCTIKGHMKKRKTDRSQFSTDVSPPSGTVS